MIKVVCDKGHWFDGEKYDSCPVCMSLVNSPIVPVTAHGNAVDSGEKPVSSSSEKKGLFGKLFGRNKKGAGSVKSESTSLLRNNTEHGSDFDPSGKTVSMDMIHEESMQERELPIPEVQAQTEQMENHVSTLADQVAQAKRSSAAEGKTVSIFGTTNDPVTGWLVCIKGKEKGTSFPLKAGQNFIGRALNMDVSLRLEDSVSRNRHATVIYEPRKRVFVLQNGESNGLTYLNEELVLNSVQLKPYDRITVGDCELAFIPFCGEEFDWKDMEDDQMQ